MKRWTLVVIAMLSLAACGNEETAEPVNVEGTIEDTVTEPAEDAIELQEDTVPAEEAEVPMEEESSATASDDPLEVGNKNSGFDTYSYGFNEYKVIERYMSEQADENGFATVDFNGYRVSIAVALVEDINGARMIGLFGETENQTPDTVQFNAEIELVTDTQEQTTVDGGLVMNTRSGIKQKGFATAPLEYGEPNSFTMYIQPPLKEVEKDISYEEGHYGEAVELFFQKNE